MPSTTKMSTNQMGRAKNLLAQHTAPKQDEGKRYRQKIKLQYNKDLENPQLNSMEQKLYFQIVTGSTPTNGEKFRGTPSKMKCFCCKDTEETVEHMIQECPWWEKYRKGVTIQKGEWIDMVNITASESRRTFVSKKILRVYTQIVSRRNLLHRDGGD